MEYNDACKFLIFFDIYCFFVVLGVGNDYVFYSYGFIGMGGKLLVSWFRNGNLYFGWFGMLDLVFICVRLCN